MSEPVPKEDTPAARGDPIERLLMPSPDDEDEEDYFIFGARGCITFVESSDEEDRQYSDAELDERRKKAAICSHNRAVDRNVSRRLSHNVDPGEAMLEYRRLQLLKVVSRMKLGLKQRLPTQAEPATEAAPNSPDSPEFT